MDCPLSLPERTSIARKCIAACVAAALAFAPVGLERAQFVSTANAQALPDLGDAAQANLSPAQERKLGEQVIRELRASGGYMNDPEVNDYLNQIGHRLVAAS